MCGRDSDEEVDNESKQDSTTKPRGTQGSHSKQQRVTDL